MEMFANISDLKHVLDFFSNSETISKKILSIQLNQLRFERHINWHYVYKLGIQLKFIKEHNEKTIITQNGRIFYSMNSGMNLNVSQKYFVLKNGILNNNLFQKINNFLRIFSLNKDDVFELYKTENKLKKNKLNLDDKLILKELDVLNIFKEKYMINIQYSELFFQSFLLKKNILSQKDLDEILDEQRRIGKFAEKLSLEYEKNEFREKKWKYQEENVKIVGRKNINIGYDIESFLTKNSRLGPTGSSDKHIEVKGRKYDECSFILSANELKVAKILSEKHNEKYLIYFWNNLGSKNLPASPTKIIPFKKLKIKPCENCLSYIVNV